MKVPPAGIEYVKVLLMSPFNFMAMACPFGSKTSMRPLAVVALVLTSTSCVAHPPPIASCGRTIAFAPPMVPAANVRAGTAVNVPVFPAASVLKFAPEKGKPRTAKGEPLCKLMLPTNAGPTVSGNSWSTNLASCLYGSMLTVAVPAVVPSSFLSVMVIAFVVPPGLTITTPKFRLTLFSTSMNKVAPVVTPNGTAPA